MMWWLVGCDGGGPVEPPGPGPCARGDAGVICTVAGAGVSGSNGDDLHALESWLFQPMFSTLDVDGRFVFADYNNNLIRRIDDDGFLRTVAGSGAHAYAIDGEPALDCPLENPVDVAIATDGTLFIYEQHGARILRVPATTGLVETWVGRALEPGYEGYEGDGGPGPDAAISQGSGIALADDGTLYIADTGNHAIRVVSPDGIVDTLAGNGEEGFVDGVGAEARFARPWGVVVDGGVLYVTDARNNAVRRVDRATGEVVTVAGTGVYGGSGDGGPALDAELGSPQGLSVALGGLYVADSDNDVIRRVDLATGIIDTVVGQLGVDGDSGDGGPPTEALLHWPNDVLATPDGDLYVVDTLNARVRRVSAP
ncbi:MAG: hypothetical protein ABMA64_26145 [Myxococcota bacterium]